MPLTMTGKKVLRFYKRKYGDKAEELFFSSIKKGISGSKEWHEPKHNQNKFTGFLKG